MDENTVSQENFEHRAEIYLCKPRFLNLSFNLSTLTFWT